MLVGDADALPSKFIGGGDYLAYVDDIQRNRVVASGNQVVINDSWLDGSPIILGGGGRTADNNTVELKAAHISNFNGTILGGMGETATGNTLKISGDSSNITTSSETGAGDWEQLCKVGGGFGWLQATGNQVEITEGMIQGTFVGGSSALNASNNHVTVGGMYFTLGGALVGGYVLHATDQTELKADGNTVTATHYSTTTPLNAAGAAAVFVLNENASMGLGRPASLSMTGNAVSFTGDSADEKLEIGRITGNYVFAETDNVPARITATGTQISLENVKAESVHGFVLEEDGVANSYDLTADTTIALTNAAVTGEVGFVASSSTRLAVSGAENSVLRAAGANRIGTLGDDVKRIELLVSSVNAESPVITFTSTENKAYTGLEVKARIGELARARAAARSAEAPADPRSYLLFGSLDNGARTELDGTIEFSGTFTEAAKHFQASLENGSTLSVGNILNLDSDDEPGDEPGNVPGDGPDEGDDPVVTATDNAKTLSESLLGSVALVAQGSEFIAEEGLEAMTAAAKADSVTAFGAMTGGHVRYETGSHVTLNSGSAALGAATRLGATTLAAFLEFGKGDSKTHASGAKADGDHRAYGVGLAARHALSDRFYIDGSLRLGRSETKFDGFYTETAETAHYDAKSTYASAHLGGGFLFEVTPRVLADVYARGIFSYLGGDTVSLGTADDEKAHFDSTTAETLQIGARLKGRVSENAAWRAGAGWIHVFGGDADASVFIDGLAPARIESPSLSGNSAVFDAGFTVKPSSASPWTFDLALKGYAGDRRGVTGTIQAGYRF